jgi:Cu2+-exporting ATPase
LGFDPTPYVRRDAQGFDCLGLVVEDMHCAGCVRRLEGLFDDANAPARARANLTTRRLMLRWPPGSADPRSLVGRIQAAGYKAAPYNQAAGIGRAQERHMLRALAVSGFAAANVMMLSVAIWAGIAQDMGAITRLFLHWISALIALPAIAYAGQIFFVPAVQALRGRRVTMDVPISLAVVLAAGLSVWEMMQGGEQVYFDAALTLLFFLLIGRYLDFRVRGRVRATAENILALQTTSVSVIDDDGRQRSMAAADVVPGMRVAVATGQRIPVDGVLRSGETEIDLSLLTGESVPRPAHPGDRVFAGTLNLGRAVVVGVGATEQQTVLSEIVRLLEVAEQGRARYVRLADRAARLYVPLVHTGAAATFVGWLAVGATPYEALVTAIAVLIITCPCALGLAVPAVQVAAVGRLLRRGILAKSGDALERLAEADTIVCDKTGTLTLGRLDLADGAGIADTDLDLAAALALTSSHPLARAMARARPGVLPATNVTEEPGMGLSATIAGVGSVRLGNRAWCGIAASADGAGDPEIWLTRPGGAPVRFAFQDRLRPEAAAAIGRLQGLGFEIELLSGDRTEVVRRVAEQTGIVHWRGGCQPADKVARLTALKAAGRKVWMIGDGLNDAPALAAAFVSTSPSSAADISQTAADFLFQGDSLGALPEQYVVARRAGRLVRQNFGLAVAYNLIAVPLAVGGLVTPLLAAIAMSASSVIVTLNALRLRRAPGR